MVYVSTDGRKVKKNKTVKNVLATRTVTSTRAAARAVEHIPGLQLGLLKIYTDISIVYIFDKIYRWSSTSLARNL